MNLECKVVHHVQFGGSHAWSVGQIQAAYVDKDYARDQPQMYRLGEYRCPGEVILRFRKG
jgi:flavin reductase (DIM6/NTAB) family NADH-FMN oxidoreductase RutF